MNLRSFLAFIGIAGATMASADIPANYYNRLDGKTGADLKQAVYEVINPHTEVSSYSDLPQYFQRTDVYPESRRWWDMYSNVERFIPSFAGLNREHAFPKSWWGGLTNVPAYVDLNHLYPSDGPANQAKSNYPLGTVGPNPKFDNGVAQIGYPVSGQGGGAQYVFEPDDEYKGDFARTYFYMVTCYQNLTWKSNYCWMMQQNDYPTLTPWAIDLLLKWHRQDPPSQKELERNEVVYSIQNNRNPFIDFADLAEHIWGSKIGEPFKPGTGGSTPSGDPVLISPTQDMNVDFGQVAVGSSTTAMLFFKGENIAQDISLSLGGNDRKMFSIPSRTINAQVLNSVAGFYLQITYTPTELGEHVARILIYDGGLPGTGTYVYLRGNALEVPTLSRLTAYDPADVTATSYTATWSPAPEVIDFYLFTRTRYIGGQTVVEQIECDDNSVIIDDFSGSDRESYMVQSSRLGYLSDPSNVVFIDHSGINGVTVDEPLSVESWPGLLRLRCSAEQTDCRIFDPSGRPVMLIPVITDGMEISLPLGVYILTTRQHPTPVKIMAR